MTANPARRASRIGRQVAAQLGGVVLAVVLVQHSAARCRQQPHAD